jgi:hypothetical protein
VVQGRVSLRPSTAVQDELDELDPDLRAAAGAIGAAIGAELARIRPAMVRGASEEGYEPEAVLLGLELEREGAADAVALSACLTANRVYVESRGHPEAVSLGALPLAHLLFWASRASVLGPSPRIDWIGPASRRPDPTAHQFNLEATCTAEIDGHPREARAVALVRR